MCQMCDDGEKASAGQEMTTPAAAELKMPEGVRRFHGRVMTETFHALTGKPTGDWVTSADYDALRTFCQQRAESGNADLTKAYCDLHEAKDQLSAGVKVLEAALEGFVNAAEAALIGEPLKNTPVWLKKARDALKETK